MSAMKRLFQVMAEKKASDISSRSARDQYQAERHGRADQPDRHDRRHGAAAPV